MPLSGDAARLTRFVLRRLVWGILTLFLVSALVFAATQALPADPARAILGRSATQEAVASLRGQLGLDQSVTSQYLDWIGSLLRGDAGDSIAARQPVTTLLSDRLVNSSFLMLCAAVLAVPLALLIGGLSAWRRDRAFDVTSSAVVLVLAALPEFVVGVTLVIVLATTAFQVLPATAYVPPGARPWDELSSLVLPTATLVLAVMPHVAWMVRASMLEVLQSDYVEMARLKGLSERVVLLRHALPNALAPTLQVIAVNLAYLAGGVVVVEYLFAYDGIGGAMRDAVATRDIPVVQALAMLIGALYVVTDMLADVTALFVTPRLRARLT